MTASSTSSREFGFALVAVMWMLALLSVIATSVISETRVSFRLENNIANEARNRYLLEGVIMRTTLDLLDSRQDRHPRADGIPRDLSVGQQSVRVWVQDVNGLIDINDTDAETLARLFLSAGTTPDRAAAISKYLLDWRGAQSSSDADAGYSEARLNYRSRHASFQSIEELKFVQGLTPDLFAKVMDSITIYSHQPLWNPAVAPRDVLLTAPNATAEQVDSIIANRNAAGTYLPGNTFRIRAQISRDKQPTIQTAVIQMTGNSGNPYAIVSWD